MEKTEDVYEEWEDSAFESSNPWIRSYVARERLSGTLSEIGHKVNFPARLAEKPFFAKARRLKRDEPVLFYGLVAVAGMLLLSLLVTIFGRRRNK